VTKKNALNQMKSFTQKIPYRNFRTNARYFPFEARKETHEQRKTKIDIDEFRSGTTNITHKDCGEGQMHPHACPKILESLVIPFSEQAAP
jgi:hypothetical protein